MNQKLERHAAKMRQRTGLLVAPGPAVQPQRIRRPVTIGFSTDALVDRATPAELVRLTLAYGRYGAPEIEPDTNNLDLWKARETQEQRRKRYLGTKKG